MAQGPVSTEASTSRLKTMHSWFHSPQALLCPPHYTWFSPALMRGWESPAQAIQNLPLAPELLDSSSGC